MNATTADVRHGLRRRLDIEVWPQRRGSQLVYVLKDPLSLRYFQLREEEYFVWRHLDGSCDPRHAP